MSAALDGLRVVEIADEHVEWAGKLLADMGADVLVVEPPAGAPSRRIGPFERDEPGLDRSLRFRHYNTSKRSLTLDVRAGQGYGVLLQLASGADVVLAPLGVDMDGLRVANARLVTATVSPWGPDGPYADYASGDLVQMAMGGIIASCGYDEHDLPPVRPGENHSMHIAGWHAVIGVLTALHAGVGQHVDVAVHDCVGVCTEFAATHWFYKQELVQRQTGRHASIVKTPKSIVRTRDGGYVNLTTVDDRAFEYFASFATEAGVDMDQYRDEHGGFTRGPGLGQAIRAICSVLDAEEVWLAGQALGMTWAAVRKPEDWLGDPHAEARGFFHDVDGVRYTGPPFLFTRHPGRVTRAPRLGEHTVETLEGLGYARAEIVALRESGVI